MVGKTTKLDELLVAVVAVQTMKTSFPLALVNDLPIVAHVIKKVIPRDAILLDDCIDAFRSGRLCAEFVHDHALEIEAARIKAANVWHWIIMAYACAAKRTSSFEESTRLANMVLDHFGPGECKPAVWVKFESDWLDDSMDQIKKTPIWRIHHRSVGEYLDFVERK